jgi:hypothetical protein
MNWEYQVQLFQNGNGEFHIVVDTNQQLTLTNIPAIKKQLIYSEYDTTMEELETRIIENEIDYALIVNCYYP